MFVADGDGWIDTQTTKTMIYYSVEPAGTRATDSYSRHGNCFTLKLAKIIQIARRTESYKCPISTSLLIPCGSPSVAIYSSAMPSCN